MCVYVQHDMIVGGAGSGMDRETSLLLEGLRTGQLPSPAELKQSGPSALLSTS